MEKPKQAPEGVLLETMRNAARPILSIRGVAKAAGISEGRWRQIENGYQSVRKGEYIDVRAPADTLARMAKAVGASPEQLRDAGRGDAADELIGIMSVREHYAAGSTPRAFTKGLANLIPTEESGSSPADQSKYAFLDELSVAHKNLWKIGGRLAHIVRNPNTPDDLRTQAEELLDTAIDDLVPQLSQVVSDLPQQNQIDVVAHVWRLQQAHAQEGEENDTDVTQQGTSTPSAVDGGTGGGPEGSEPPMSAAESGDNVTPLIQPDQGDTPDWLKRGAASEKVKETSDPNPDD